MFEKDNSLLGRLIAYGKSDMYPFHMPGHKRKIVDTFPNPFEIDITEIDGFDNLHHAEGILKEQENMDGILGPEWEKRLREIVMQAHEKLKEEA